MGRGLKAIWFGLLMLGLAGGAPRMGQLPEPGTQSATPNPLVDSTMNAGQNAAFRPRGALCERCGCARWCGFCRLVRRGRSGAGQRPAPVVGNVAIGKSATWSPKDYQLTWTPTDAVMGPSGDMGYTWGHFEGHSKDANGNPVTTSGRYITIWRKQADGSWKVVLDAGANDAPAGDCCKLPGPGI